MNPAMPAGQGHGGAHTAVERRWHNEARESDSLDLPDSTMPRHRGEHGRPYCGTRGLTPHDVFGDGPNSSSRVPPWTRSWW